MGVWNEIDNGFVIFTNLELPKSALLNRYNDITDDGKYVTKMSSEKRFGLTLGALR